MADCTETQRVSDILPLEGALTQETHFVEEKKDPSPQEQREKYRYPPIETPTYWSNHADSNRRRHAARV